MSRSDRLCALALAPIVALAGCATPVAPPAGPGESPSVWSGRFAVTWVQSPDPLREDRATGRFLLRERGTRTELEIYSPFGQTVARALAGPDGATLETSDGARHEAPSPEALTERVLGWRVPVGRLPHWLRDAGRGGGAPAQWTEADWTIDVDAAAAESPPRLTLRWPASPSPGAWRRVTIRLVLDAPATQAALR